MYNLFTYGSLMFSEVWNRVVDGNYRSRHATLRGYVRRQLRGETYPAIVPAPGESCVDGVLYCGIIPEDMARLDRFEGDYYTCSAVTVLTTAGAALDAYTYVLREQYHHMLSAEAWDTELFLKEGIQQFLSDYSGFDR